MENTIIHGDVSPPNLNDFFVQKQIEFMIEANHKKIVGELKAITDSIARLNEEVGDIKRNLTQSNRPKPSVAEPTFANTNVRHDEPKTSVNGQQMTRPRYGDYKSEDVSISKFFNFGGGRRQ